MPCFKAKPKPVIAFYALVAEKNPKMVRLVVELFI